MYRLLVLVSTSALLAACYRLPLAVRANDATGYEDVGIPTIQAIEYTPSGRDVRVHLEQPGYVTVIVLDPLRGASVRFRRGELKSAPGHVGVNRFPLDRLESPMLASAATGVQRRRPEMTTGLTLARRRQQAGSPFIYPATVARDTMAASEASRAEALRSERVGASSGPVRATHVLVIVTEQPLDIVNVGMRLARSSLDPSLTAQQVAEPTEGGRWMAAIALLRGQ